jgi:flagellar hook protein FlgE
MSGEVSTIQSLKAVDAWIDVINANINGGVRTAFKSSRLKFSGSNVDVARVGSSTSLPLQFPEPGLATANTVIDFSQGAITASTENSHLAIQGEGFFVVVDPGSITAAGAYTYVAGQTKIYLSRDGEFSTDSRGLLKTSYGYYLVTSSIFAGPPKQLWSIGMKGVYNNLDISTNGTGLSGAVRLSDYLSNNFSAATVMADGIATLGGAAPVTSVLKATAGKQNLKYTQFGSTVFDYSSTGLAWDAGTSSDATILSKSLEASNASMTQSVPELSLAQKLFSALTKVLQTKQTNIDGVLNLVR